MDASDSGHSHHHPKRQAVLTSSFLCSAAPAWADTAADGLGLASSRGIRGNRPVDGTAFETLSYRCVLQEERAEQHPSRPDGDDAGHEMLAGVDFQATPFSLEVGRMFAGVCCCWHPAVLIVVPIIVTIER